MLLFNMWDYNSSTSSTSFTYKTDKDMTPTQLSLIFTILGMVSIET